MTVFQSVITIMAVLLGTAFTRFIAFLIFPDQKKPPKVIQYLGTVLPYAVMGLLVVYSLKNVTLLTGSHGIPEFLAMVCIVILHLWKRNLLLSITAGTIAYMLMVQVFF